MKTDINRAVKLNSQINEFRKDGFISFAGDYIQVTEQKLMQIRAETKCPLEMKQRADKIYPYEVSLVYRETTFLSIGSKAEFKAVGVEVK